MFDPVIPDNLEEIPAGRELALALAALDWDALSDYDLIRALRAQDRQVSHYQAGRAWTINKVAERDQSEYRDGSFEYCEAADGAAAEVGAALRLTRRSAEVETGFSIELLRHRPAAFEALLFGRIDFRRARVLVDETLQLSDTSAHVAIERLLPDAAGLTAGQLRHRVAKLCIDAVSYAARRRYENSIEDRRFEFRPDDSGTADILGRNLPPHLAESIGRWIHKEAIKLKNFGDTRTMDQLRADIYLDLLRRRYKGREDHSS